MNLGGAFRYSAKGMRRNAVYHQLQSEAAARPGAELVDTAVGRVWMSPIEAELYAAMVGEGLAPLPQFCIQGYFVDFAFPDIRLAVEADGAAFHSGAYHTRDHKRDWILQRAGWTVTRFHGTTIYHKAGNCAYVVRREVDGRRAELLAAARTADAKRQARRDAYLRPFRALARLIGLVGRGDHPRVVAAAPSRASADPLRRDPGLEPTPPGGVVPAPDQEDRASI